jgi:hypothetical protein
MIGIQVGAIGLIAGTSLMWVIHSGVMADQMAAAIQIKSFRTTSLHGSHRHLLLTCCLIAANKDESLDLEPNDSP